MILFPRFQLVEIEDCSWCPSWLREYSHKALHTMWSTVGAGKTVSVAGQACELLLDVLPNPSAFTFIDACAGAGGPTPLLEAHLNKQLKSEGKKPVQFMLTDLYPDYNAWKQIVKRSENISYVDHPVDATKAVTYAPAGKKECRIFNLCFHHFTDENAVKVLRSGFAAADAVIIFEMTYRNLVALLNTTIVILSPLITTLLWFWYSPMHIVFTYLIPVVPLFFMIDGYVSCIRTRTPEEINALLAKTDIDLSKWDIRAGSKLVLPPFGYLYYYTAVKKTA